MKLLVLGTGSADGWPNPFCRCESCQDARLRGEIRTHTSVLVDDVVLFDLGPDTPRSAERSGAVLADVEHIVISHGHPDHLEPAALLWRSWLNSPAPLHMHGPAAALELVEPWLPPVDSRVDQRATASDVTLHPIVVGDTRRLDTARGTYTLTALAANHQGPRGAGESASEGDVHRTTALAYLIEGPDEARVLYATDTARLPRETIAALTGTALNVVFLDETFGTHYTHGTGHHDLRSFDQQLIDLRSINAITDTTDVIAVHMSHHNPSDVALRLRVLGASAVSDRTVIDTELGRRGSLHLLIGGARSGKSLIAEHLASEHERAGQSITYIATAPPQENDAEWDARIAAHRDRRPRTWQTRETLDLVGLLVAAGKNDTLLIDCMSLWMTGVLDAADAWANDTALDDAVTALRERVALLIDALLNTTADVIVVTNEVGQGVVPSTKSGRVFRDELGRLNAALGSVATRADFVVAGRLLPLTNPFDAAPMSTGSWATPAEVQQH